MASETAVEPHKVDEAQPWGLALSGGGFRALLFHLGTINYLRNTRQLEHVKVICAVSGGSVLAAHLVLNWKRYIDTGTEFEKIVDELMEFVRKDVRGRVVRRYFPRLPFIPLRRWLPLLFRTTLTSLLEDEYRTLFRQEDGSTAVLSTLPNTPDLHILATDLCSGDLCDFCSSGVQIFRARAGGLKLIKSADVLTMPVAKAVAASSAFPALFPAIPFPVQKMSRIEDDVEVEANFPCDLLLSDGGVFDNVGIALAKHLSAGMAGLPFIISDAGKPFEQHLVADQRHIPLESTVRATEVMQKRVAELQEGNALPKNWKRIDITQHVRTVSCRAIVDPGLRQFLSSVRTDFDYLDRVTSSCLIRYGFCAAWQTLNSSSVPGEPYESQAGDASLADHWRNLRARFRQKRKNAALPSKSWRSFVVRRRLGKSSVSLATGANPSSVAPSPASSQAPSAPMTTGPAPSSKSLHDPEEDRTRVQRAARRPLGFFFLADRYSRAYAAILALMLVLLVYVAYGQVHRARAGPEYIESFVPFRERLTHHERAEPKHEIAAVFQKDKQARGVSLDSHHYWWIVGPKYAVVVRRFQASAGIEGELPFQSFSTTNGAMVNAVLGRKTLDGPLEVVGVSGNYKADKSFQELVHLTLYREKIRDGNYGIMHVKKFGMTKKFSYDLFILREELVPPSPSLYEIRRTTGDGPIRVDDVADDVKLVFRGWAAHNGPLSADVRAVLDQIGRAMRAAKPSEKWGVHERNDPSYFPEATDFVTDPVAELVGPSNTVAEPVYSRFTSPVPSESGNLIFSYYLVPERFLPPSTQRVELQR